MAGGDLEKPKGPGNRGPTRQRPWFRLPPKVQIVPGILGHAPSVEPRVEDLGEGELKVGDDCASGHCPEWIGADGSQIPLKFQIGVSQTLIWFPNPHFHLRRLLPSIPT